MHQLWNGIAQNYKDFDDIWQKYSKYFRIEFVCFSFHVGLLVVKLSSLKLHTENNARMLLLTTGSVMHFRHFWWCNVERMLKRWRWNCISNNSWMSVLCVQNDCRLCVPNILSLGLCFKNLHIVKVGAFARYSIKKTQNSRYFWCLVWKTKIDEKQTYMKKEKTPSILLVYDSIP